MKIPSYANGICGLSLLAGFLACSTPTEESTESTEDDLESCTSCPTSCGSLTYTTNKECSDEAVQKAQADIDYWNAEIAAHDNNAGAYDAAAADEDAYYEYLRGLLAKSLQAEMALQQVIQGNLETACQKVEHTTGIEVVAALAASTNPWTEGAWAAYEVYKEGELAKQASIYALKEMPHVATTIAANVVECPVWQKGAAVKPIALDKILNKTTVEFAHKSLPFVGIGITALQIGASISDCNKAIDKAQTGALAAEASSLAAQSAALTSARNAAKAAADSYRQSATSERSASASASVSLTSAQAALDNAQKDKQACIDAVNAVDTSETSPVCTVKPDASCGDSGTDSGDSGNDSGNDGGTDSGNDSGGNDSGGNDGGPKDGGKKG